MVSALSNPPRSAITPNITTLTAVQVNADPPSIQSISVVQSAGGFAVQLAGVADTRDLTQATVSFQPAAGSSLTSAQLTVPLSSAASAWFAGSGAASHGGQFSLTLPFTLYGTYR